MESRAKQYLIVTSCYWAFTLTDGALRMLMVLYFHNLSYSPLEIASIFLLYEFFGIVTNLLGGWFAAKKGLDFTLKAGLLLQILALCMLLLPPSLLHIAYVMLAQALSGIAKDLSKMSAKSSIKKLIPDNEQNKLYSWIAWLTGSKNTLKGAGFFLGAALFSIVEFRGTLLFLIGIMTVALALSTFLNKDTSPSKFTAKFNTILSKSSRINTLSAARFFLFGSRDIWFVVALPVYLQEALSWTHVQVGSFMAIWIITYGIIQSFSPTITRTLSKLRSTNYSHQPNGSSAYLWCLPVVVITLTLCSIGMLYELSSTIIVLGLILFGVFFAINSSIHSYLIVSYASEESVSLDVGFYYMANAAGRLIGTILSGLLYQQYGLTACLAASACFMMSAALISTRLPKSNL